MNDETPTVPRRTCLRAASGIATAGMAALAGCQDTDVSAEERDDGAADDGETGRLTTQVTPHVAMAEAFESCSMTIDGLVLVPAVGGGSGGTDADSDADGDGNESEAESNEEGDVPEPEYYAFDDPRTMELVDPETDATRDLDDRELPTGSYQSLLLDVSSVDGTIRSGGRATITVPEDEPLQFSVPFDIRAETTTTFVADVAPVDRDGAGEYALRPFSDGTTVSYGDGGTQRTETDEDADGSADGDGTKEPIADRLDVVHAVGHVSPADTVTTVELTVKKRAGTDAVDLSRLTLEFADETVEATLAHGGEGRRGEATAETFVTTHITGEGSHDELVSTADRVTITFDASLVRSDDGLPPGSSALVALVDPTGARYAYGASIPSTFGEKSVVPL